MGFTCSSIPARVYMHLTPRDDQKDRASERERMKGEDERGMEGR